MKAMILTVFVFSGILFLSFTANNSSEVKLQSSNLSFRSPLDLSSKTNNLRNSVTKENTKNSDWYSNITEDIRNEENYITYNKDINSYQSPNRANNVRFIYHKDGFSAEPRITRVPLFDESDLLIKAEDKKYEEIPYWKVNLNLSCIKRDTRDARRKAQEDNSGSDDMYFESGMFANSELKVMDNTAFIENENVRIDYTNSKDGMRQDFIIKKRPEGVGKLRLNLSADTKLKMNVGSDALMFKDNKGIDRMKYSALKCWDANHRELRAYFENNYELRITNYELKEKSKTETIPNPKFQIPNFSVSL